MRARLTTLFLDRNHFRQPSKVCPVVGLRSKRRHAYLSDGPGGGPAALIVRKAALLPGYRQRGGKPAQPNLGQLFRPTILSASSFRPISSGAAADRANRTLPCCRTAPRARRWALPATLMLPTTTSPGERRWKQRNGCRYTSVGRSGTAEGGTERLACKAISRLPPSAFRLPLRRTSRPRFPIGPGPRSAPVNGTVKSQAGCGQGMMAGDREL